MNWTAIICCAMVCSTAYLIVDAITARWYNSKVIGACRDVDVKTPPQGA